MHDDESELGEGRWFEQVPEGCDDAVWWMHLPATEADVPEKWTVDFATGEVGITFDNDRSDDVSESEKVAAA